MTAAPATASGTRPTSLDLDRAADLVSEASRRLETGEAGIAATAAAAAAAILSGGAAVAEAPDAD